MDPLTLLAAFTKLTSELSSLAGPYPALGQALARAKGVIPLIPLLNDRSQVRKVEYELQRLGVERGTGRNYENTIQDPSALIRMLHQSQLIGNADGEVELSGGAWAWLQSRLACHGIDLGVPADNGQEPAVANDWLELVRFAATAAPLEGFLRGWHRVRSLANDETDQRQKALDFALRRGGYSRSDDRQVLLFPYAAWSTQDAEWLTWMGLTDEVGRIALYRAAGYSHQSDELYARWRAARLPDSIELGAWAQRQLWNDNIARLYGLDDAFNSSPLATFFSRAQGAGLMPGQLPGTPPGETDWLKLAMRAGAPLVGFREALELQWRLRPDPVDPAESVIPGVPQWTADDTRNMLTAAGYTKPIADRLMGLATQPLNVRILNTVLHEALLHPDVALAAQNAFGVNVDWVKEIYLDHGFADHVAQLAADGARAKADDAFFAERTEHQKNYRKARRDLAMKDYAAGFVDTITARDRMVDEQFSDAMAVQQLQLIDDEVASGIKEKVVASIKEAYISGKIDLGQMGTQMQVLGVTPARVIRYTQEWTWERGDKARMLSTGEILQALKHGLMTVPVATQRLTNLGWTAQDALIEIAQVEQDLATAASRSQATLAAKSISSMQRTQKAAEAAAKSAAAEREKAARAAKKRADAAALLPDQSTYNVAHYDASVFMDLHTYNNAVANGHTEKADAMIAKAEADFRKALIAQAKLRQQDEQTAAAVEPIAKVDVPPAPTDEGAGQPAAGAASQPGAAPDAGGGAAAAPGT